MRGKFGLIVCFALALGGCGMEQASAPSTVYGTAKFKSMILGKSKQDVIAMLGGPDRVAEGSLEGGQNYAYNFILDKNHTFRVSDETTGVVFNQVDIDFDTTDHVAGVRPS